MTVLFGILAILFVVLIVGIPLLEKYGSEKSDEELSKMSRYMMPLMVVLFIAMIIRYLIS
ncbi:hypothetical protein OAU36_05860 [Gammaproteobacteria bacterium]|jgi:preprotein translocase subunit SecG|nr:hypothetical protein [Pseudomonadales bacterium]MBT5718179.1 hypothetical protein [Gammaproteobacteria bacterium]MDC0414686.1 hypothetical protein [Gammaproteobacteria bacterium]MDC3197233.1 hypothetical protein [Gammaproteobacteria bacterium]HAS48944.1 hypothetical protein [Gammaproteobacteria bacterium]